MATAARLALPWLAVAALALARPAWAAAPLPDIGVKPYGGDFHLRDHNGQERTLADFRGRAVILFFGYTQCPDFCPTTLTKMSLAMKRLGADASKVQVLFVTIDPERDSQALLAAYVPKFNPGFLGLRGDAQETARVAQSYGASYRFMKYQGQTLVDHTTSGYLLDTNGKTRLSLPYTLTVDQIATDVRAVLKLH